MKNFSNVYMVDEGWNPFEKWFGSKTAKEDTDAGKTNKFFGTIGAFFGLTKLANTEKNAVDAELEKIFAEKQANAEKRLTQLKKSKEGALAAKLRAKFNMREKQLDLANQRKVDAFDSIKSKLVKEADFFKNTNIVFSDDDMLAYETQIESEWKALEGTTEYDKATRMMDLIRLTTIDKDGNPRSLEDAKKFLNDNPEIKKDFENTAKECNKNIKDAVESGYLEKCVDDVSKTVIQFQTAKNEKETADKEVEKYNNSVKKYKEYKTAVEEYKKLKEDAKFDTEAANKEKNNNLKNLYASNNDIVDDTKVLDAKDFQSNLNTIIRGVKKDDYDNFKKENNIGDDVNNADLLKYVLKKNNIPENLANEYVDSIDGLKDLNFKDGAPGNIDDSLNAAKDKDTISQDELNEAAKTALKQENKKIDTLKKKNSIARAKLDSTPDPETDDRFAKIRDAVENGDGDFLDDTTEIGKEYKNSLLDQQKAANANYKTTENAKETLGDKRNESETRYKTHNEIDKDPDLNVLVQKREGELNHGEVKKDGKIGYYSNTEKDADGNPKFIERPDMKSATDADENDQAKKKYDKYEEGRKANILTKNFNDFDNDNVNLLIDKVKKQDDGTYTAYDKEGKELETGLSQEEAADRVASKNISVQTKHIARQEKQDFLDKFDKIYDDEGNKNEEEYNKLSDGEKKLVDNIVKDPDKYKDAFSGLQIGGKKFNDYIKDVEFDDEDANDDENLGDDKESDNEEGEMPKNKEGETMAAPKRFIQRQKGKRKGTHRYVVHDVEGGKKGATRMENGKPETTSEDDWRKNQRYWRKYLKSKKQQEPKSNPEPPEGEPQTDENSLVIYLTKYKIVNERHDLTDWLKQNMI